MRELVWLIEPQADENIVTVADCLNFTPEFDLVLQSIGV